MFTDSLSPNTFRGIKLLGEHKILDFAYLAGGTALALYFGHRESIDLDFFSLKDFDTEAFLGKIKELGEFKEKEVNKETLLGSLSGVRFSLFHHPYKLLDSLDDCEGVRVAGLKDIAAMKIHAMEGRGSIKDFIDLFFLKEKFSIEEMIDFYDQKYQCLDEHKYTILKSLSYFEDAEAEEVPKMIKPMVWQEVKEFFQVEAMRLSKKWGIV